MEILNKIGGDNMRFLLIREGYYLNIDTITSINCDLSPFIQFFVNGKKVYELRYIQENYVEFCKKLVEKIVDDEIKIVDMHDVKNEVCRR